MSFISLPSCDPALADLRAVIRGWTELFGPEKVRVERLITKANQQSRNTENDLLEFDYSEFREALLSVAGAAGKIDGRKLAHWLRKHKGRIVDGYKIEQPEPGAEHATWRVRGAHRRS